ncbi:MAG: 1-deoxy-D-xylulose-5-phosphate reductoisomerase [Deltaproteobacteria bacterium]|jgi:1-deoxy-D-xylulose-5-phosphate reductoisomerase|nr:1-deoxy-D-xylulose-5-phosphate reductoisomerase [Deltaproteobacteria bacterium]
MKSLSILGSTGSIGLSTLDVVGRHPDKFNVVALAEGHDVEMMSKHIEMFRPKLVSVRDSEAADKLRGMLQKEKPEIVHGISGACQVAAHPEADTVVSAIVGAAGLKPTVAAIKSKKRLALANKETMVVAGALVSRLAKENGVEILPIDSEHSAIFQSLVGHRHEDLKRILLTASGGPFRGKGKDEIDNATPEAALKHPKWLMGAKITIDSASLMNKGLEVIEAKWLFNVDPAQIDVVVHPQSIIHSMVEYRDGCVVAQLGVPDMRAPIAYAISYPERIESGVDTLDLKKIGELTFEDPDREKFPCLNLAFESLEVGRSMPAVLNAANEIAVDAFLKNSIKFGDIYRVVRGTMDAHDPHDFDSIDEIVDIDRWAREKASGLI